VSPVATDEEPKSVFQYRILRYLPNLARDEWVNIGVLLEETSGARQAVRLIEEPSEFARVRRLHSDADEDLLRALAPESDARLRGSRSEVTTHLQNLDQILSNALQLSPPKGLLGDNFDAELDQLYRERVTPPARRAGGLVQNTRNWLRSKLNDVFRRHQRHRRRLHGCSVRVVCVIREPGALVSRFVRCGWVAAREFAALLASRTDDGPSRASLVPTCAVVLAATREFPGTPGSSARLLLHHTS
jgi:hypothetical protein